MANLLRVRVDAPADALATFGAGALVRLEHSITGGGAGFTEVATAGIVAGQTTYDLVHAAGLRGHWYRDRQSRASPVGEADFSPYSAEYQGGVERAYADLDDFTRGFEAVPPGGTRTSRILDVLEQASSMLTAAIGWDFFRRPAVSGMAVQVLDGTGERTLHVHSGIVSLATVEVADGPGLVYTALAAADWYLEPLAPEPGEPFDHVTLAEGRSRATFPAGQRRVRLTGVFGYPAPSPVIRAGTIALARQLYRADATVPGGLVGPDEWSGGPEPMPRGWPDAAWRAVVHYRGKFFCHV